MIVYSDIDLVREWIEIESSNIDSDYMLVVDWDRTKEALLVDVYSDFSCEDPYYIGRGWIYCDFRDFK